METSSAKRGTTTVGLSSGIIGPRACLSIPLSSSLWRGSCGSRECGEKPRFLPQLVDCAAGDKIVTIRKISEEPGAAKLPVKNHPQLSCWPALLRRREQDSSGKRKRQR